MNLTFLTVSGLPADWAVDEKFIKQNDETAKWKYHKHSFTITMALVSCPATLSVCEAKPKLGSKQ